MNFPKKLITLSLIIIGIDLVIGYSVYKSNQSLQESKQIVNHSELVILQTSNFLIVNKEIESSLRGYIIGKDSLFIEELQTGNKKIYAMIEILKSLTQDNKIQQIRMDSIKTLMTERIKYQLNQIELRKNNDEIVSFQFSMINQGKLYSDKIQTIIIEFRNVENNLLYQRNKNTDSSLASFYTFLVVMFALMTTFTILMLLLTGNYFYQNKEQKLQEVELLLTRDQRDYQTEEKTKQTELNKELEAFSYSVSHDLRAPLRHIGGFVNLLLKNNASQLDERGLRFLNIISESSIEMGKLIDALLSFSRLSRGDMNLTMVNTKEIVNDVIKTFSDELVGRKIKFNIGELPSIMADEALFKLVWINLISNAIKYTQKKAITLIAIGSKIENNKIIFSIKDNGAGFDMKYADKLFGVFQRLHKAKDFEGIGIGLANVNRIITRHNGKCWAESSIDNGATFFISLPKI